MRNPLVLVYKSIANTITMCHGNDIFITDEQPNTFDTSLNDEENNKFNLPGANISYVSGNSEKALMREYEPHGVINNLNGTYTIGTEALRYNYLIQVSFFAKNPGTAFRLASEFVAHIEKDNEIPIEDKWESSMTIFTKSPPIPPRGEGGLYQSDITFSCEGKLIIEEIVNSIDIQNFKPKIGLL